MDQQAPRKRKLSDGGEPGSSRAVLDSREDSPTRFQRCRLESALEAPGCGYRDIDISGPSKAHLGNNNAEVINVNYHSSEPSIQTEEDSRWARFVKALGFKDMDFRRFTIDHGENCSWILSKAAFVRWQDEALRAEHRGFLWIKGKPGVGKSTLMKFLYEHFGTDMPNHTLVSYFFHRRGTQLQQSVEGMYRSILSQLLRKFPRLRAVVEPSQPIDPGYVWDVRVLQDTLHRAVISLEQEYLIWVIDALDEGDHKEVSRMVTFLGSLTRSSQVRNVHINICLASRHFPNIPTPRCEQLVVERESDHMLVIKKYISDNLDDGIQHQRDKLSTDLLHRSQGVFLWVVLVIRMLNDKSAEGASPTQLSATLRSIPDDLQNLLHSIITAEPSDVRLLPALQWVLVGHNLDVKLFYAGVQIATGERDQVSVPTIGELDMATMERFAVHSSRGLLEVSQNGGRVQFIHESVREHILSGGLAYLDPRMGLNPKATAHARIAEWCQDYIRLDPARCSEVPRNPVSGVVDTTLLHRRTRDAARDKLYHFPEYTYARMFAHMEYAFVGNMLDLRTLRSFPLREWIDFRNVFPDQCDISWVASEMNAPTYPQWLHLDATTSLLCVLLEENCHEIARTVLKICATSKISRKDRSQVAVTTDVDSAFKIMGQSLSSSNGNQVGNALSAAAYFGHMDIVQLLIDLGADVNIRSGEFGSALLAAEYTGRMDVVQLLIDHGANVNMHSGEYGSALATAASRGWPDAVEQLLHLGATVDKDSLRWALSQGCSLSTLKHLLARYGGLNADELSEFLFIAVANKESQPENIELLVRLGADCGKRDKDGNTALHIAAGTGSAMLPHGTHTIVEALVVIGAKLNAIGGEYGTALIAASAIGNATAVRTLLEHGADPYYRSDIHGTAIEAACKGRRDAEESDGQIGGEDWESQFDETVRLLSEAVLEDKPRSSVQEEATVLESSHQHSREFELAS